MKTNNELIGKYLNRYLYTDVEPMGRIIDTREKSILIVKKVIATKQTEKMNFIPGGFSAICTNNHSQNWLFEELEETFEVRLSKSLLRNVKVDERPIKFYDYNF